MPKLPLSVARRLVCTLLLPLLWSMPWLAATAQAEVLQGLYQVQLAQQAEADPQQQASEALLLVLGRLAGSKAVSPRLIADEDPAALLRRSATAADGSRQLEFEPVLVNALLHRAGIPMLGRNRPAILLWGVQSGSMGDEWLNADSPWLATLQQAARHRGVALSLPLGDLQDRSEVDEQRIRKAERDALLQASQRYAADAVLALGLSGDDQSPSIDWHFWLNQQSRNGRLRGDNPAALADQLMLQLADEIIGQYALQPQAGEASGWSLQVQGIRTLDDYAGLMRTLTQLGTEQPPRLLWIREDQLQVELQFPGSLSQLQRLLALDQRLRPLAAEEPEPAIEMPVDGVPGDAESVTDQAEPSRPEPDDDRLLRFQWR